MITDPKLKIIVATISLNSAFSTTIMFDMIFHHFAIANTGTQIATKLLGLALALYTYSTVVNYKEDTVDLEAPTPRIGRL